MPARRRIAPTHPVTITLDGERITAEEGEPLARSLVAADRVSWSRSPKLHRPRGAACHRGACEGCLARVDGVPNVLTCLAPAKNGSIVETQNVVGSRNVDLLRVTDWFFPHGIDHHHLLAGVPGAGALMQVIARRVAGLGRLPDRIRAPVPAERRVVDALVVGAGASGWAAASTLAALGHQVVLVDDGVSLGGSASALGADRELSQKFPLDRVETKASAVAAGVYENDVLVVASDAATLFVPKVLVLACGSHDGVELFEGNDLPSVYSARAGARLAAAGVVVGERVVIAGHGPYADRFAEIAPDAVARRIEIADLVAAVGSSRVGAVLVKEGGATKRVRADALIVERPGAPAFELAEQAGAVIRVLDDRGYAPVVDGEGRAGAKLFICGELGGASGSSQALAADGVRVARAAATTLG